MPELPDITIYVEALQSRVVGHTLEKLLIKTPFLLRTVGPSLRDFENRKVVEVTHLGKRLVIHFEHQRWAVIHLMILGRLHWKAKTATLHGRHGLCAFVFEHGALHLTESGTKRRAMLHLFADISEVNALDRGGVDVLRASKAEFQAALQQENHTLKRALTDPRILSGIGNAYSDEILHRAQLSPLLWTKKLSDAQFTALYQATQETLREWIARLRAQSAGAFPEKVTAFHTEMSVHGKYNQPCPRCAQKVQRIRYADRETNYCPHCQTEGVLLRDRSLSRMLKNDWPKTLEELEDRKRDKPT